MLPLRVPLRHYVRTMTCPWLHYAMPLLVRHYYPYCRSLHAMLASGSLLRHIRDAIYAMLPCYSPRYAHALARPLPPLFRHACHYFRCHAILFSPLLMSSYMSPLSDYAAAIFFIIESFSCLIPVFAAMAAYADIPPSERYGYHIIITLIFIYYADDSPLLRCLRRCHMLLLLPAMPCYCCPSADTAIYSAATPFRCWRHYDTPCCYYAEAIFADDDAMLLFYYEP